MPIPHRLLLVLAPLVLVSPVRAQAPDGTGAGSAAAARNTTAVGQTKPPGRAAAPKGGREGRTSNEKKGDAIDRGICIGCDK